MTQQEHLLARLADIVRAELRAPDAAITRATSADDIDGWDSLAHTRLLLVLEKTFGVRFPGSRLFDIKDVGEIVDLIVELQTTAKTGSRHDAD